MEGGAERSGTDCKCDKAGRGEFVLGLRIALQVTTVLTLPPSHATLLLPRTRESSLLDRFVLTADIGYRARGNVSKSLA